MTLHPIPLNFLIYEENFFSIFNSATCVIQYLKFWDTLPSALRAGEM